MNKFVSYDIKPYVYISDECEVEKANELVNLVIHEQFKCKRRYDGLYK